MKTICPYCGQHLEPPPLFDWRRATGRPWRPTESTIPPIDCEEPDVPIVAGGQGRGAQEQIGAAAAICWCVMLVVLGWLAVWLGWVVLS